MVWSSASGQACPTLWTTDGLKERQVITLFPSPLFTGRVSDLTVCDRIEAVLRAMQKNGEGSHDETFFMSRDDIHKRPEMKELVDLVMAESGRVLDFYKVKRQSHYITDMWGNITNPNHRQALHIHPNCLLSGIIYVTSPPYAVRPVRRPPPRRPHAGACGVRTDPVQQRPVHGRADRGVMLMWPSFMPHAVERGRNRTHEDRIIVAFNVMIRGTIDISTAHLELK